MVNRIKEIVWNLLFKNDIEFVRSHYVPTNQLEQIAQLEILVQDLKDTLTELTELTTEEKKMYEEVILEKQEQILLLKSLDVPVVRPKWLMPSSSVFKPKVTIVTKTQGEKVISLNSTDIYSRSTKIVDIVAQNRWKDLYLKDKKACAMKIWIYVIKALSYEYDKGEDWRFSPITLSYRRGDCEDGTILFLDLAREAGFRADEVFNATGWVKTDTGQFGHSYPILNYGEGWYIYESTLNREKDAPMKFEGSKYTADWGIANWYWYGKIEKPIKQI